MSVRGLQPREGGTDISMMCPTCQTAFHPRRYWQRFCSPACKTNHHNARRQEALSLLRERDAATRTNPQKVVNSDTPLPEDPDNAPTS